ILITAGAKPANLILVDSKGIVGRHRKDVEAARGEFAEKWELAQMTNGEGRVGGIPEAMKGVDVVIAASKPGPGVIQKEWVTSMADGAILNVNESALPVRRPTYESGSQQPTSIVVRTTYLRSITH